MQFQRFGNRLPIFIVSHMYMLLKILNIHREQFFILNIHREQFFIFSCVDMFDRASKS
jgi:hypothetical protein